MILRAVAEPGSAGAVEQLGEFADVTDADHYVQVIQICPVGRSLDPPFRLLAQGGINRPWMVSRGKAKSEDLAYHSGEFQALLIS